MKNRRLNKKMKSKVLAAAHTPDPPPASNVADFKLIPLNEKKALRGNLSYSAIGLLGPHNHVLHRDANSRVLWLVFAGI